MEGHSDLLQPIAEIAPELWILSHHSSHIETKRNLVAPDRRMVSSMSPTIVEDPQGRLFCTVRFSAP